MNKPKTKLYKLLSSLNKLKWSIALKGLLVGIVAGLLAVFYRIGIEYGTETAVKIYSFLKMHPLYIILWVFVIVTAGFFIAWLVKLEPMATGSGIPQVEGVVLYGLKMKWYSILAVRFVAGLLCSFIGLSLGREGPSIQIGAAGGQSFSKKISKSKLEENYLITGGAAAGLSAAFNAPVSGMVFALEEVHRSFSPLILISATAASLMADFVSKYFFGLKPVLYFTAIPQLPIKLYLLLFPVGLLSGIIGSLITKLLLGFQTLYGMLPAYSRPGIAFIIAFPCGLFLPEVLGSGHNLIKIAENHNNPVIILTVLLTVKLVFTSTSFGSGVPGGIFMPILSVGALSGSIFGITAAYFGMPPQYIPVFAVCAMSGALSSSVKAPVTSILLAAEMSGSFIHLLPVAICSFIALFLSDVLKIDPIYETLLERFVEKKGSSLPAEEKGGLLEIPVELGSSVTGKLISEIEWPSGSLIVGLRRGTKEFVPKGKTKLLPGDYLVVLTSKDNDNNVSDRFRLLCHCDTN